MRKRVATRTCRVLLRTARHVQASTFHEIFSSILLLEKVYGLLWHRVSLHARFFSLSRLDRPSSSRFVLTCYLNIIHIEQYIGRREMSLTFFFHLNYQLLSRFHNCSDKMITRSVWIPSLSANSSVLSEDSPSFIRFLVDPCSQPSASALTSSGARLLDPSTSSCFSFASVSRIAETATVAVDVVTVVVVTLVVGRLEVPSKSENAVAVRTVKGKLQQVSEYLPILSAVLS